MKEVAVTPSTSIIPFMSVVLLKDYLLFVLMLFPLVWQRAVEELKRQAYKNVECWVAVDQTSVFGTPLPTGLLAVPSGSAGLNLQNVDIPVPHQGI